MPRTLITDRAVRDASRAGQRELPIATDALVTPLARDTAKELGIKLVAAVTAPPTAVAQDDCGCAQAPARSLVVASDHAGFEIKAAVIDHARSLGWEVSDLGTDSDRSVDYPDYAYAVARAVATGKAALGVMIDGVGVGSAMVANKVPCIRAACCSVEFAAFNARAHNDANVLTIGSRTVGLEANRRILEIFLTTAFEGGRHASRVAKITDVEDRFLPSRDSL
jgi:ribose 5-phosphate isomerase B